LLPHDVLEHEQTWPTHVADDKRMLNVLNVVLALAVNAGVD